MTQIDSHPTFEVGTATLAHRANKLRRAFDMVGVQNISLIVALIVLCAVIGSKNRNFFLLANIQTIGTSVAIVGVLAVVQTVVMLLGGLDIDRKSTRLN